MQRKTAALLEIRDGSEAGDLGRAEQGAAQLRRISEAASSYLPDQGYNALRGDFADALAVLDAAVRDRDLVRLKAAYAKLAKSCLECHRRATKTRIDAKSFQVITTEQLRSNRPAISDSECFYRAAARMGRESRAW